MPKITRESVSANIAGIRQTIAEASSAAEFGNEPLLVAVSKTVGIEEVAFAIEEGIHDFGENRTDELVRKHAAYPEENWHFIGRIQTNKLKDVVGRACLIHSVASIHALDEIEKRASRLGIVQPILLEVNVSGEESKDGFAPAALPEAIAHCGHLESVEVRGLMTMAPLGDASVARATFHGLRCLRDELRARCTSENVKLDELSMGMSQDFPQAIAEGATIIRLGRSVFS